MRVVVIGAGFAGLSAAKSLSRMPVGLTIIDQRNHHLFQPLLYQVATAGLSPADIATPIRGLFSGRRNVRVLLGQVTGIVKLPRFRGHRHICVRGVHDVEVKTTLRP